ncbi:c-type cytochrome [Psychromonas sp. MME2]|uniref:c-type cytochrome n=1 Tax=unclassified Psychromonas TaxID=2614957 RepID=UPI00339BB731
MQLIRRIPLLLTVAISLVSLSSLAQNQSEGEIAARIAPVGDVYLQGDIATAEQSTASSEPAEPRSGEKIYNTYCVACHATGAAGAPITGDAKAWSPRIAQGQETLLKHAINGLNAMPPRGTCANCSDQEMASAVAFLTKGL